MKIFLRTRPWITVLLFLLLAAVRPCAARPAQPENRFLFIIDTASAMRGYSNDIVRVAAELLDSDIRGELRKNDTIGLWTYNDRLHPDFPMEIWSPARKRAIIDSMAGYLLDQRYQKSAHWERVMPLLNQVIKSSDRLTAIIIFDGNGVIQGTPFDKDLATLQKKYGKELRAARVPFVLVLSARSGAVFDYTINYPGMIAIPHTAVPEPVVAVPPPVASHPTNVVAAAPPAQPRPARSIIMSRATNTPPPVVPAQSPTPAPTPQVAATPAPVATKPAPSLIMIAPKKTNSVAVVTPAAAPSAPSTNASPNPAPIVQTGPLAVQPVPAVVASTPSVTPAPTPALAKPAPAPTPAPAPAVQATPPVASAPPKAAMAAAPVVPTEAAPAPAPVVTEAPSQAVPAPASPAAPLAAASEPKIPTIALFIAAFSLLTIAVVLVLFLARRSKGGGESSLITQSIDRRR